MSPIQQANTQGSDISMFPGIGSGNRNPNIRTSARKPCVCAECNHPKQIKRDPLDRAAERRMCKRMEKRNKEWLDQLLDEQ